MLDLNQDDIPKVKYWGSGTMGNKSFRIKIIPGIMVYKKCDKLTSFAGFFLLQALQFFLQLKKHKNTFFYVYIEKIDELSKTYFSQHV